jgi:hypothetical protein
MMGLTNYTLRSVPTMDNHTFRASGISIAKRRPQEVAAPTETPETPTDETIEVVQTLEVTSDPDAATDEFVNEGGATNEDVDDDDDSDSI